MDGCPLGSQEFFIILTGYWQTLFVSSFTARTSFQNLLPSFFQVELLPVFMPASSGFLREAEVEALKAAATEIKNNLSRKRKKMFILTDAVQNPSKKDLNELITVLSEMSSQADLLLQWIPAHCGIYGNEKSDRLAKEGGLLGQRDKQASFSDEMTIIKTLTEKKMATAISNHNMSSCLQYAQDTTLPQAENRPIRNVSL